jgi:ketosteroid isomerase-like protein
MTANKRTVTRYLEAFSKNDYQGILSCLGDDIIWEIPGVYRKTGKDAFAYELENSNFSENPTITVTRIIEESDVVMAEGTMVVKTKDAGLIDVAFCDVFTMKEKKINHIIIYIADKSGAK